MRPRTIAVAFVATGALALAGCGGGGGGASGGGGDRLTKQEFVTQADAICKDANDRLDALGTPTDLAALAKLGRQALQIGADQLGKLKALNPPQEISDRVDQAYDLLKQEQDLESQVVDAAEAGDLQKVSQLGNQVSALQKQSDRIAKDLGLEVCASS